MTNYNPEEINLELTEITPFARLGKHGIILSWSSDIGFGEYTLYQTDKEYKWYGESECMDWGENKQLLRALLQKLADMVEVVE